MCTVAPSVVPSFLDSMKCPICLDYASRAVETMCCSQVYCQQCVQDLIDKDCPSCREPGLKTCVSRITRKTVSEIPVECSNSCGERVTRGSAEKHAEICPNNEYICPLSKCEYSGLMQHLVDHMAAKHPKEVFHAMKPYKDENVDESIQTDEVKSYFCPMLNCEDKKEKTEVGLREHIVGAHHRDENIMEQICQPQKGPIEFQNSEGRSCSMAPNGKFYCGTNVGVWVKNDDDEDGDAYKQANCNFEEQPLNCHSCMKFDVTLRNLPFGSMVNGAGHVAKPNFCTHGVKGSEYFAARKRSALCRLSTCGNGPRFSCGKSHVATNFKQEMCTPNNKTCYHKTCYHCSELGRVAGLTKASEDTKVDYDYYDVWVI